MSSAKTEVIPFKRHVLIRKRNAVNTNIDNSVMSLRYHDCLFLTSPTKKEKNCRFLLCRYPLFLNNLINQSIRQCFIRRQEMFTVGISLYLLDLLAGMVRQNLV